ncbi:SBBP repeat-containing protein [Myxococcota bacterium]|nr:SBBP repeat-containing protein [Myxococcota bacterium]MBU1536712.1 SBBP repeat-containing protein [Myxococcota bacterium]
MVGSTDGVLDGGTLTQSTDIFASSLTAAGVISWTVQLRSLQEDWGNGIGVDAAGNIYLAGQAGGMFEGFSTHGSSDIALIRIDSSGSVLAIQLVGTTTFDNAQALMVTPKGVYYTGSTNGLLGPTSFGGTDAIIAFAPLLF